MRQSVVERIKIFTDFSVQEPEKGFDLLGHDWLLVDFNNVESLVKV